MTFSRMLIPFGFLLLLLASASVPLAMMARPLYGDIIVYTDSQRDVTTLNVTLLDTRHGYSFGLRSTPGPLRVPGGDFHPAWSPDGQWLAVVHTVDGEQRIDITRSDGGGRRTIVSQRLGSVLAPRWSPDGRWLSFIEVEGQGEIAYIVDVNIDNSTPQEVARSPVTRFNGPQWSPDGRSLLYLQGRDFGEFSLTRINRATGAQVPMLPDDRPVLEAAWSPDGTHLLYTAERRGRADIYVIAVADGEPHNLTENNFQDTRPSWSPDGTQIAFLSNREGGWHLYVTSINGEPAQRLTTVPLGISATWATLAWSPDGARIAYTHEGDLFTIETADGSVRRLTIDQPIPATLNWFTFRP